MPSMIQKHQLGRIPSGIEIVEARPDKAYEDLFVPAVWVTEEDKAAWTKQTFTFHCGCPGRYVFRVF